MNESVLDGKNGVLEELQNSKKTVGLTPKL